MNRLQRRLFRAFLRAGGDLSDAAEVERLIRYIEGMISILPDKTRNAFELAWRSDRTTAYTTLVDQLSEFERSRIRSTTMRQRVSRAARALEEAIHRRDWRQAVDATKLRSHGRPLRRKDGNLSRT